MLLEAQEDFPIAYGMLELYLNGGKGHIRMGSTPNISNDQSVFFWSSNTIESPGTMYQSLKSILCVLKNFTWDVLFRCGGPVNLRSLNPMKELVIDMLCTV